MRLTRRDFAKISAAASAGLMMPWRLGPFGVRPASAQIPGGSLAPGDVQKWVMELVKPPAFPRKGRIRIRGRKTADYYEIAMRQFYQQILPGHPATAVWSYGPAYARTADLRHRFFYPAFTLENTYNKPTVVKWVNGLGTNSHLLPVDQTLHWANPVGDRDTRGEGDGPYTGPVPMVTHVHGAHTFEESDGYPEAWYLPDGANGVNWKVGSKYDEFKAKSENRLGIDWDEGTAVFDYPNDQRATTLWYHDHTLGMTRVNVYAGPAGFYLIRGGPDDEVEGVLPGPAPGIGLDPFGEFFEIPIAIQDRSFNADGSLFYPDDRAFFDGFDGPFIPETNVPPIWNPEFFGNMMVVNGRTWPYLNVKRQRYRFRFLNGCNSRFVILKMTRSPRGDNSGFNTPEGTFWQIGAEGGFLPQAQPLDSLVMAPAERADVIIDFSEFNVGDEVILVNDGPDAPFGDPNDTADISDWASTGQVMKFIVGPGPRRDPSTHPAQLGLPAITSLGMANATQNVTLNEEVYEPADVPSAALLGSGTTEGGLLWSDEITENPEVGATEEWNIYNFTEDAHPIHVHLVQFQVVGRQPLGGGGTSVAGSNNPLPWETGFKDTVIAYPQEVTTIKAKFDKEGLFVWHCHIVEHEDNEMMRPYRIGQGPLV